MISTRMTIDLKREFKLLDIFHTALIEARWRELVGLPDNFVGENL
jgi:hypothetical protein